VNLEHQITLPSDSETLCSELSTATRMTEVSWKIAAHTKKAAVSALIPSKWRLKPAEIPSIEALRDVCDYIRRHLSSIELHITELSAEKTVAKLRSGEWTALEVTRAFCHRAAIAHQLVRELQESISKLRLSANRLPDQLPFGDFL